MDGRTDHPLRRALRTPCSVIFGCGGVRKDPSIRVHHHHHWLLDGRHHPPQTCVGVGGAVLSSLVSLSLPSSHKQQVQRIIIKINMADDKAAAAAAASSNNKGKGTTTTPLRPWTDDLQGDYERLLTVGEECVTADELRLLIQRKGRGMAADGGFRLYDGFEPSGRMHIAQGVFKAMNVNKCTAEGTNATFCFWVADWFALMNDKMGGDLDKIKTVGEYLIEVWKAAGMHLEHVEFKWASTEITQHANTYWPLMLDVARRFNITRIKKCCQIMGRLEGNLTAAQVLYPLMQCTDVFFLQADICQLGVDQRKVNMLAREYCDAANRRFKPIILSHHMLYGLKAGQEKMSKSDPDSAIFMEDAADDVERKIRNAYCPTAEEATATTTATTTASVDDAGKESMHLVEDTLKNPCLDYVQHIIFSPPGATFTAGGTTYTDFVTVKQAFLQASLSPDDLKTGLIHALNQLLEPVRQHFTHNERAKDLLAKVQQYKKETSSSGSAGATASTVRRLDLVALGKVPANAHMVMAPLPVAEPTLQHAMDIVTQLQQANDDDAPKILFLSDWTARVCNAVGADVKVIAAFYDILVAACRALNPPVMQKVQILHQSDAILADPSNYWISVINAGRHFLLDKVMGPNLKDADGVGHVIGRLMKVADVAGVAPATVAMNSSSSSGDAALEAELITDFFTAKLPGVTVPSFSTVAAPSLRLLPEPATEAEKTPNDEYFLLDDPKVHGKSKLKKAFCEPGNVTFCPPIDLADVFVLRRGDALTCQRKPENGGDKTYATADELRADYASQALHPGDLKAAVTPVVVGVLDQLAQALKADKDIQQAVKTFKNYQKKAAKAKK